MARPKGKGAWIKVPESDEVRGMYLPPGPQRWRWIRVGCRAQYRSAYRECVKDMGRMRAHHTVLIPGRDDREMGLTQEG